MDTNLIQRLCIASIEKSHMPEVDVEWNEPFHDDVLPVPESLISIYGLPEYARLSRSVRARLARHELASIFSTLIRLECVLTHSFARMIRCSQTEGQSMRFILHEIEEEARHSRMFRRGIRALGVRAYPATGLVLYTEVAITTAARLRAVLLLMILASEEMPDLLFQRIAADSTSHPLLRRICQIHRTEEARHIAFAKAYFRELYSQASPIARRWVQAIAPPMIAVDFDGLVQPEVYKHAGVVDTMAQAWRLWRQARKSSQRSALRQASVQRLVAFLGDTGVIDARTRPRWIAHGLIPVSAPPR